jgi:hypothetical protein
VKSSPLCPLWWIPKKGTGPYGNVGPRCALARSNPATWHADLSAAQFQLLVLVRDDEMCSVHTPAHASWVPESGRAPKLLPSSGVRYMTRKLDGRCQSRKYSGSYFMTSRISPAAAITLSTSRERALACWVAWVRSSSTAATPAERSRSKSNRTFCMARTHDSR